MKTSLSIILLYLFFPSYVLSDNIYCTGHDACRNKVWTGEYNIYCGGSNSERTCRNTVLNCGEGDTCLIKTQGSGHDAYQSSTVNAKTSASFKLYCQASGQRDCKSITVWCPQESGSTCECISCPSTVTFKCVQGVSCSSVSNAYVDYVQSDTYSIPDSIWYKDTAHTGKRPNCPFSMPSNVQNYLWATLSNCKTKCIEEKTGKCNMVSRYGDSSKSPTEAWHCRFYECPDPYNFTWITQTQWGNFASECNTYMLPIRHYTLESRYVNVSNIVNVTNTINITNYVDEIRLKYTPYQIKTPGTNTCPIGFSHIKNINECRKAQEEVASDKNFQGIPHPEHPVSGCYLDTLHNRVYMPPASHGSGHTHMTPICKATCENITNKTLYHYINKTLYSYINKTIIFYLNDTIYDYKNITNIKEIINYINKTIYHYKNITNVNDRINYVNETRYLDVPIYINKTRYQNVSREIIHLINRYNYVNKTNIINITKVLTKIIWREKYNITNLKNITNIIKINWINRTRWINKTTYKQVIVKVPINNKEDNPSNDYNSYDTKNHISHKNETCNCREVHPMSFWVQIGFFITLGFSVFAALVCIWRCWLKDMIEEFVDDLFCCGYGDQIKMCCGICCMLCELCKDDSSEEEEVEMHRTNHSLEASIPTAQPVNKNIIIDTNANPIYRIEEGVTTPGGTQIRRRTVQV